MATRRDLTDFPLHALLPKKETGVESFLQKYPEYDGSGTVIAIFDSGVDPGAPGLTLTSDGRRKIVDLIDCTGSGDVDTSTIAEVKDGCLQGKSGRKLKIPEGWTNPSGKYHIGIKSAYSLFPAKLKDRVKKERKEKDWDPSHKHITAEASRTLHGFNQQCPKPSTDSEKLEQENVSALVDVLDGFEKKFKDSGPVYDCIVFHDGNMWRACVDTSEEGDLESCQLLGIFKETGDYARFSDRDMMNYSVNIHNDGNVLSIVANCSSHGTHVASIAAAYFEEPDSSELNGVAPGAQIISMKIGDTRLETMETGSALVRAMICAMENKVDVINMSYGESAKWANAGRVIEVLKKMVDEHNIVFITSAGNDGPALGTVGAPGGTCEKAIGVGAYVSPDMMSAEYSLLEKLPGMQYTWSSRGPCEDGSLGVCITAPGGAITSVPNWTLMKCRLMNGTSMSSPNACGGVAVLLSALKKEDVPYSPKSIRRCLENSALRSDGVCSFTQGYGMLQVHTAFDVMREMVKDSTCPHVSFQVDCGNKSRGIYRREAADHARPDKYNVTITPQFQKEIGNEVKLSFHRTICLVPTASWVSCAPHLSLANSERSFPVSVNSSTLPPGSHYAEVQGFDLEHRNSGPLFRIPISAIIPEKFADANFKHISLGELRLKPGAMKRWFYVVPNGATWAAISLKSLAKDISMRYVVHALQVVQDMTCKETQLHKHVVLKPETDSTELIVKVKGGYTLEVCIAHWWACQGEGAISAEVSFHGLEPDTSTVILNGCETFTRIDVRCNLGCEEINPNASLTHYILPLTPKENDISPLSTRDVLPHQEQIYNLILTYQFTLSKPAEVCPVATALSDLLYESKYESQFWMIFDSNKALCGCGDAYPIKYEYTIKLEKGDYLIKFQIRHSKVELLEEMKDMVLNLHIKLATPVTLDFYSKRSNLFEKSSKLKFQQKVLSAGQQCAVYLTAPSDDKWPKGIKQGQYMYGSVSYTRKKAGRKVVTYPLQVTVPPPKSSDKKSKKDDKDKDKEIEKEYKEALDNFMVSWIGKLEGSALQSELITQIGDDSLPALDALLNAVDSGKDRSSQLLKIIDIAQKIISKIDQQGVLAYYAMKVDPDLDASKTKSEMDQQKNYLVNAAYKMGLAMADSILGEPTKKDGETSQKDTESELGSDLSLSPAETKPDVAALDICYRDFAKLVDASDVKMAMLTVRHGMVHKHYGRALKALNKYLEDNGPSRAYCDVQIQLCESLGWDHIVRYLRQWMLLKFPSSYEMF